MKALADGVEVPFHSGRHATASAQPRCSSMFFFFSNRLGCLGSVVVSIAITVVVLALLGVF